MATTMESIREHTWLIGDANVRGFPVEVWQRCREDQQCVAQDGSLFGDSEITTPDGYVARVPDFWNVQAPKDARRLLIVCQIRKGLVGVTLRFPDLDIDITESVVAHPPKLYPNAL